MYLDIMACIGPYAPCCAGEVWNETLKQCVACPLGHHGPFCRKQCEYPYYGKDCGDGVCECEKEICNFATGCQQTTEVIKTTQVDTTLYMHLKTSSGSLKSIIYKRSARNSTSNFSLLSTTSLPVKDGKGISDLLENPVVLGIVGVNFIFLVFIFFFVGNKIKKSCTTKSTFKPPEEALAVNKGQAEHLYDKSYEEIRLDYSSLNEMDSSCNRSYASLAAAAMPMDPHARRNDELPYDDVANVI